MDTNPFLEEVGDSGPRRRRGAVGRPKRYRNHKDEGRFISIDDAVVRLHEWLDDTASPAVKVAMAEQSGLDVEVPWYPVSAISVNDPRVCWIVVDAALKSAPKTYIRTLELAPALQQRWPIWYWEPVVLGRILAGIRHACESRYYVDFKYVTDEGDVPFAQGRDGRGRYYVVDPQGGNEGRLWLWALRGRLLERSTLQQAADSMGDLDRYYAHYYNASWLGGTDPVMDKGMKEFQPPDPIRSKEAFEAQLTNDPVDSADLSVFERAVPYIDQRARRDAVARATR